MTLLFALLARVVLFLKMRTVTLNEIQLQLAALEDALVSESARRLSRATNTDRNYLHFLDAA
jgi:hypothetical protein